MSKRNVEKALRTADRGEAYHWPTIAEILAGEVRRLRAAVETTDQPGGDVMTPDHPDFREEWA